MEEIEALFKILARRGIMSKEEVLEEIKKDERQIKGLLR